MPDVGTLTLLTYAAYQTLAAPMFSGVGLRMGLVIPTGGERPTTARKNKMQSIITEK